jgi:hypothetical protein
MLVGLAVVVALAVYVTAGAQVLIPPPDQLRFQTLLSEPIATPSGGAVVAGTSAMVVKDRRSGQCYVVVTVGQSAAMSPAACAD